MLSKNFNKRIFSGILLFIIMASAFLLGDKYFTFFLLVVLGCVSYEILVLSQVKNNFKFGILTVSLLSIYIYSQYYEYLYFLIIPIVFLCLKTNRVNLTIYTLLIVGALKYIEFLYFIDPITLLGVGTVIVLTDTGGYFFGKIIGGKKVSWVSPNKTWSGVFGGWVLVATFTLILYVLGYIDQLGLILFSIVISIIAQIGDFYQSYLKRTVNIKDTSNLIPGHGGILDRFDGWIFVFGIIFVVHSIFNI